MDAGGALVEHLFGEMQVDERWAVRRPRGFSWWAGELAQHVWADAPIDDYGHQLSRVHVQTDVLSDLAPGDRALSILGATTGFSTMSGPLVGEGGLRLAASVFVHDGTLRMWKHLLAIAALIQVTEAHITAPFLAESTGAKTAVSPHPWSGIRKEQDDMLNVIHDVFAPMGVGPSLFAGHEFADAEEAMGRHLSLLTSAGDTGLTSEFPFGEGTALLQMLTEPRNPRLGSGLMMILSLPTHYATSDLPRLALQMNQLELSQLTRAPFLGSWCPHATIPNTLCFVSFFPNACSLPGLPTTFLQYSAGRARWMLESVHGETDEASRRQSQPAVMRFLRRSRH